MADDHDDCPGKGNDLIFVGPPVDEKRRLYMRHRPDCQVDIGTGEFRGAPEKGEILPEGALRLRHRDDGAYDVKEEVVGKASGPAHVNSEAFRDGWSRIFGGPQVVGKA